MTAVSRRRRTSCALRMQMTVRTNRWVEILSYTLKKQVENKVGYALTILKNGYNEPTRLSGKKTGSAWNNKDLDTAYEQMNFADLEKQILSN